MRAPAIRRLARLLRLDGGPRLDEAALKRRLETARASAASWKARATELVTRAKEQSARMAALRGALRDVRAQVTTERRELPSVALARGAFAHRLSTLLSRARVPPASEREAHFVGVSSAYRAALNAAPGALSSCAERVELEGMQWWVPPKTGAHRLPYRSILLTREVAIGGIMLDLGANIGRMAVPRVVLGDVSAAYCAEPDPLNFACLARTVIDNGLRGLVLPDQTAIGDHDGTVRLLREGSSGNFRVLSGTEVVSAAGPAIVEVPCCRLDTWVERLGIDLDAVTFIKVDVEGFERRVVAGAARVLACRHIAWQIEIKPEGLRGAGDDPAALYADLQRVFTHFTDLNRRAQGARVRPVEELGDALAYVDPGGKTDVLLFSTPTSVD